MILNRTYFPNGAPAGRKQWVQEVYKLAAGDDAAMEPKASDTKSKRYVFVLSSDTPDMSHDVIDQDNWNLDRFRKSAPALWAHNADMFPIGKWVEVWREGNKLVGSMEFAPTATAQQARALVDGGYLKGVSVGFAAGKYGIRKEGGVHFQEGHTLLEASLCPIGCQPDALFRGVSKDGDPKARKAALREEVAATQARQRELDQKYPKPEPKPAISELELARARRAERQRVALMDPNELRDYMNAQADRKERRRIELAKIRGQQ
jgi:HK97 family phage prohead protease